MSKQLELAKTIADQIGFRTLMALGAKDKKVIHGAEGHSGGLFFAVSLFGDKRTACTVSVVLNGKDLYNVLILHRRTIEVFSATDLYAEDLGPTIEYEIESFFAKVASK